MKGEAIMKLIFGILIAGLVYLIAVRSLHCGDFRVQGDAQFFYGIGARQLDGWDKDGRACEALLDPSDGTAYF